MFFIEEPSEKPKYRPPSKSDSFLYEKGSYFALTTLSTIQSPPPPIEPSFPKYISVLHFVYPFLFHITLISIFESAFFFAYVSTLEDNGILNTIQNYVNPLLQGCWNWTAQDRVYIEEMLNAIVNTSTLSQEAIIAAEDRSTINASLMRRSWIYVGGLATLTALLTGVLVWKKHPPKWKSLLIEQCSMVLLLAAYEWLFFRTIVLPYKAISITEVNYYIVQELDTKCNLVMPQD
jgi:cytochrome b subunit of formate dehydrogenase